MNSKNDHAQVINPFVIYMVLGVIAALLQRWLPLPALAPARAPILGTIIMVLSLAIGLPSVLNMLAAKTTPNPHRPTTALVFSGPYRFSRNPMYVGLTLLYVGLVIYFRVTWGLLLLPAIIWLVTIWVIVPEETYLEQKFGTAYLEYKSTVRRWI